MRWQHSSADPHRRVSSIFLVLLAICCLAETQSSFRRKFEYKLSFKGPHLVQKDGTIPFWEHFGSMHTFLMIIAICYVCDEAVLCLVIVEVTGYDELLHWTLPASSD